MTEVSHGWAIVARSQRSSWIMPFTIQRTRAEAIQRFVDIWENKEFGRKQWLKDRKAGRVKCVRVVTEVQDD